jgi:hypothetical protein
MDYLIGPPEISLRGVPVPVAFASIAGISFNPFLWLLDHCRDPVFLIPSVRT